MNDAAQYYCGFGFRFIETPWAVPMPIGLITAPNMECMFPLCDGLVLVGSGEQSLLYLIEQGIISTPGKFQTTTPCFRNEKEDVLHKKYFLKNELMIFRPEDPEKELVRLVDICAGYVVSQCSGAPVAIVQNLDMNEYDITVNGIEVGSYGIRNHHDYCWVYGTGRAEPRMSTALALKFYG